MQIREECINTKNELALHLKWKRFTEAILKNTYSTLKSYNLKINTTSNVKADLHGTILGLASCVRCINKAN